MSADNTYLTYLENILENGYEKEDRTGTGTYSVFGRELRFDLQAGFPLLTTKKVWFHGVVTELLWMLRGETNIGSLLEEGVHIWDDWADNLGNLGSVYGATWRRLEVDGKEVVELPVKERPAPGLCRRPDFETLDIVPEDDDLTGNVYTNKNGLEFKVAQRLGTKNGNTFYRVQFLESGSIVERSRPQVRSKGIKDPYALNVQGVACVGQPASKPHWYKRAYNMWSAMIARCYNEEHPTYPQYGGVGVYVSPRWLNFEYFLQDISQVPFFIRWVKNPGDFHLDKDYFGSDCYSKDTCIFLTKEENHLYSQATPIQTVSPGGAKEIWVSIKDFAEEHGWDSRRVSEQAAGKRIYDSEWDISQYIPQDGHVVRYRRVVDQIKRLVDGLCDKPNSRRLLVDAWDARVHGWGPNEKVALSPCHYGFQCWTRPLSIKERTRWAFEHLEHSTDFLSGYGPLGGTEDSKEHDHAELTKAGVPGRGLSLKWTQRSVDSFLGLPFNIAFYALLTHMLAQQTGMVPLDLIFSGGDCHIYKNHLEQVKTQIRRTPNTQPALRIKRTPASIFAYQRKDFEVVGYDPKARIEAPIAV